jgi:hypothetical protein
VTTAFNLRIASLFRTTALFLVVGLVGQGVRAQSALSFDTSLRNSQAKEFRLSGSLRGFTEANSPETTLMLSGHYAQPIGDGMHLLYSPLPLGIRYALPSDGYTQNTVAWNLDVQLNSVSPRFTGERRAFLSKRFDFLSAVEYFAVTPFDQLPSTWSFRFNSGLETKLLRDLRFGMYAGVVFEDTLHKLFAPEGAKDKSQPLQRVFPLTASIIYTMSDGWKVSGDYTYRGLDGRDQVLTHIVGMALSKTW